LAGALLGPRSPDALAGLRGPTSKGGKGCRGEREKRRREEGN